VFIVDKQSREREGDASIDSNANNTTTIASTSTSIVNNRDVYANDDNDDIVCQ